MNRIAFISALATLLVTACSKPEPAPTPEQFDKYIFFSQNVDTKASLIGSTTDMDGKSFGVVGFKYDSSSAWATEKATATPNVFATSPQAVTCDANGSGTYSPIQGWSNSKEYTFFAFYPMPIENNVELVNLNGTSYSAGVPAIKYSLNTTDATTLKASMVDVMTATYHEDKYWRSTSDNNIASGEVTMEFAHKLSSLGVRIKNSSSGQIKLITVALVLSDIKHNEIIIPLDGTAAMLSTPETAISATLSIAPTSVEKTLTPQETPTYIEIADKLMFIPQTENVSANIKVSYKRQFGDTPSTDPITFTSTTLTTSLVAGNKHLISLNFTDDLVDVEEVISSEGWNVIPDIEDTFN